MKVRAFIIGFITGSMLVGIAWAKNFNADGRGQTPSGNWVPLNVDSNGYLKIAVS